MTAFELQNAFFDILKRHLMDVKIFKILSEPQREKFILIESIKEESLIAGRKQFNVVLHISSFSFDYKILSQMLKEVDNACTFKNFESLERFINFKFLTSFISSNLEVGFESKLEFACFFLG